MSFRQPRRRHKICYVSHAAPHPREAKLAAPLPFHLRNLSHRPSRTSEKKADVTAAELQAGISASKHARPSCRPASKQLPVKTHESRAHRDHPFLLLPSGGQLSTQTRSCCNRCSSREACSASRDTDAAVLRACEAALPSCVLVL